MEIRTFIKNLGDKAPEFFDAKPVTVARWLKTGNIPLKAAEKVMLAMRAFEEVEVMDGAVKLDDETYKLAEEAEPAMSEVDPVTHLPTDLNRKLPAVQSAPGHAPQVIEMNPTEQSFGLNLTRPGRPNTAPLPPMKIRKVNGQNIPYIEQPKPVTVMPPEISGDAGWSNKGQPLPQPEKNERRVPQGPAKEVSPETVP
jgi:hypothetical protein